MRLEIDLKRSTLGLSHKVRRGCWKKNKQRYYHTWYLSFLACHRIIESCKKFANECKGLRQNSKNWLWKDGGVSTPPNNNVTNSFSNSSSKIEITPVSSSTIFCQTAWLNHYLGCKGGASSPPPVMRHFLSNLSQHQLCSNQLCSVETLKKKETLKQTTSANKGFCKATWESASNSLKVSSMKRHRQL